MLGVWGVRGLGFRSLGVRYEGLGLGFCSIAQQSGFKSPCSPQLLS